MAPLAMPLKEAAIVLAKMGFEPWLKAHGKLGLPALTKKQAMELRECFELIDAGGSGVISTRDVPLAFIVLGMDLKRTEIEDAIREVMAHRRSMQYPQFMRVMMSKVDKLPVDDNSPSEGGKDPSTEYTLPFALLAQAYRRRKLIEAVMGGDKKLQDRMQFRSHKAWVERKALRGSASGKSTEDLKGNSSMTVEPIVMRHRPTMKRQVIHVQALKTLRDFYKNGSIQVKGSPLLYPASL